MRAAISKFFRDIKSIFHGRNLIWQGIAFAVTYFLVVSGFDWWIVTAFRDSPLRAIAMGAGFIGFFAPIAVPLICFALGALRRNRKLLKAGLLLAQAEVTALLLSFFYKAFTGRPGPTEFRATAGALSDISHVFRFGFLEGGVFWGWPSSHVIVSVAGAVLLMVLCKSNVWVKYLALAYAVYIALAVSITFHWFSDAMAAVIFGAVIGVTVARSARD